MYTKVREYFMNHLSLLVVFGTRPEVIKLAPVISELKVSKSISIVVLNTEQQKELSNQALKYFGLSADIKLNAMTYNQTLTDLQCRLMQRLDTVFQNNHFDGCIVQGDTMTVLAASLVSFYHKVPVFHVEAGLRSNNLYSPYPEEAIRRIVSKIATLHFAPTQLAYDRLINEGTDPRKVTITGNTSIDAIKLLFEINKPKDQSKDKKILITVHRRENQGEKLESILDAVLELSQKLQDYSLVLPVHPNPNVKQKVIERLKNIDNVILTPPMDYPELIQTMSTSEMILTDSGGIQEEATLFNIPILVLRDTTERYEGVESGHAIVVGTDKQFIVSTAMKYLKGGERLKILSPYPYGDGKASKKIVSKLLSFYSASEE